MGKIGRNDPCPCGSGKKYKYCCLRKERQARQAQRGVTQEDPTDAKLPVDAIRRKLEELPPGGNPEARADLERLLDVAEAVATYEQNREAIEAASDKLDAYRSEFEQLMSDPRSAMDYARDLFSEDRFADLRFTPEDIHQAFETVGYPRFYREKPAPEDMETLFEAMLSLVNEEERFSLSRRLLLFLPEYVDSGRHLDAWMIRISAYQMAELTEQSNPFLTSMFFLAYDEWQQQFIAERDDMLDDLGLDPARLEEMTEGEFQACIDARMEDPDWEEKARAYYQSSAFARDQAEAQFYEMEHESVDVLQRDDAQHLYLSREEVAPWVYEFMERQADVIEAFKEAEREDREPDAEVLEKMNRVMAGVVAEMAESIFTPERKEELAEELAAYRRQLQEAGEYEAAQCIYAASATVTYDEPPVQNPFLMGLCFHSLRAVLATKGQEENQ